MTNLAIFWQLATAPADAFKELRERPRFVVPLIAVVLGGTLMLLWYYSIVDIDWLKDNLMSGNKRFQELNDIQRDRVLSMMSRKTMITSGVLGTLIGVPFIMVIQSVYYLVAGRITNVRYSFVQWLSFCAWCSVPSLIGALTGCVVLLMAGGNMQISPYELQPLSLNNLFFQLAPNSAGAQLLATLNLPSFLGWLLLVIGARTWSERSWFFSAMFALLPFIVVYGCWALIAFSL